MRTPGSQPRILLTNVKQLELLLTRQRDVELFADARLDFLVFDEAHTFTGAQGAETACLIRRLRAFCGRGAQDTVCVATSATIVDRENPDAARDFASRFFGVPNGAGRDGRRGLRAGGVGGRPSRAARPAGDPGALLTECVRAVEDETGDRSVGAGAYRELAGGDLLGGRMAGGAARGPVANELVFQLTELLAQPRRSANCRGAEGEDRPAGQRGGDSELAHARRCGATRGPAAPAAVVHGFVRGISGAVVSFPRASRTRSSGWRPKTRSKRRRRETKHAHFPVTTCTTCGQHYFVAFLKDFEFTGKAPGGGEASGDALVLGAA